MPSPKKKRRSIHEVGRLFKEKVPSFEVVDKRGGPGAGGFMLLRNHVGGTPKNPGEIALNLHLVDQVGSPPFGDFRGTFHSYEGHADMTIRPDDNLEIETKRLSFKELNTLTEYALILHKIMDEEPES